LSREFVLYKAALQKNPNSIKATLEAGNMFLADGKYAQANEFFEKAVVLSKAANNMVLQEKAYFGWSNGLAALSEIDKAVEAMEAGAKAEGVPPYRSSFWAPAYLMVLNYSDTRSRDDVSRTHLEWGKWQREVIGPYERPATRNRDRNRKLRIGYLSGDLYDHVVADSVEGVLLGHNRDNVHVTCYQLQAKTDAKTARLKELSDAWVLVAGLPATAILAQIRSDNIDICVELGGHTESSRLDVTGMCPAPIMVTWMGYPNTTGVDCIDYRITDGVCDPPESTQIYSEKLVRLPTFFHSLSKQDILEIPVGPAPPICAKGHITFGSFNNLQKHSEKCRACWGKVLLALPTSQLLLKARVFASELDKKRWEDRFIELALQGTPNFKKAAKLRKQLIMVPTTPMSAQHPSKNDGYRQHINMYNDMDVMLDSWPYAGTTTTAEAILMGVPVVTMLAPKEAGCHSQNVGASVLKQIGLGDLVATSEQEFVEICVGLASNPERLKKIKETLRDTCLQTICKPVAEGLCKEVEEAFREMWTAHLDATA
jgi:predicted O-linked N-acetylglucosamine transferase (SPINDLY family)